MYYQIFIASPPTASTPTRHHQHHAQGLPREGVPYSLRLVFFCRCSCYCGCASKDYVKFANFSKMIVEKRKDNEGMMWRINVASKEMLRAPVTSESGVGRQIELKTGGGTRSCFASSEEGRFLSFRFFFLNFLGGVTGLCPLRLKTASRGILRERSRESVTFQMRATDVMIAASVLVGVVEGFAGVKSGWAPPACAVPTLCPAVSSPTLCPAVSSRASLQLPMAKTNASRKGMGNTCSRVSMTGKI